MKRERAPSRSADRPLGAIRGPHGPRGRTGEDREPPEVAVPIATCFRLSRAISGDPSVVASPPSRGQTRVVKGRVDGGKGKPGIGRGEAMR